MRAIFLRNQNAHTRSLYSFTHLHTHAHTHTHTHTSQAVRDAAARAVHSASNVQSTQRSDLDADLQQSQFMALMQDLATGRTKVQNGELKPGSPIATNQQEQQQQQQQQQQQHDEAGVDLNVNVEAMDDMMRAFSRAFADEMDLHSASPHVTYEFQHELQVEDEHKTADDFVQLGTQALAEGVCQRMNVCVLSLSLSLSLFLCLSLSFCGQGNVCVLAQLNALANSSRLSCCCCLSWVLLHKGELSTAIVHFESACQLDRSHTQAWELLGTR